MSGHEKHEHHHGLPSGVALDRAFIAGVLLNLLFVAVETYYGIASHSIALLADAGHNFGDVLGLLVAWLGSTLGRRSPTPRFTYGLGSASILAALFNSLVLLVTAGGILVEAMRRIRAPAPVAGDVVMMVAAIGIVINAISAIFFRRESRSDLNVRAAFVHLVSDAVVSVGVVVTGLAIVLTGSTWIDSAVSIAVALFLVFSTWRLLTQSFAMALNAVPEHVDVSAIDVYFRSLEGVAQIHDLHVWPISTTKIALTCHVVIPGGYPGDRFVAEIDHELRKRFGIAHSTIQIETGAQTDVCAYEGADAHGRR